MMFENLFHIVLFHIQVYSATDRKSRSWPIRKGRPCVLRATADQRGGKGHVQLGRRRREEQRSQNHVRVYFYCIWELSEGEFGERPPDYSQGKD